MSARKARDGGYQLGAGIEEERIAYATSLDFSGLQADVVELMRLAKLQRLDAERFLEAFVEKNQGAAVPVIRVAQRGLARRTP